MSKGDYARIYVRGIDTPFVVTAMQNGRTIEIDKDSKEVSATERTRGGTLVRRVTVPKTDVVAVEENFSGD